VRSSDPVPSRWDVISDPNGALAWAATAEPGEVTAEILEVVLNLIEPARLTRTGRIDLLLAAKREQAWAAGVQHRALSMIAASHAELACAIDPDGKQSVVEEIRCALNVCADEAKDALLNGTILAEQLPTTLALLEKGELSPRKVQWLCEATSNLDPDLVPALEECMLRRGAEQSHAAFKRSLKTALATVAPKTMQEAREDGMAERRVVFTPREDGMTALWALLPSEGALVLQHALRALATTKDKTRNASKASRDVEGGLADTRTFAQREADALIDMSSFILNHDDIPTEQGLKPRIVVTMTLETLLGLNDIPADLDGVGPLTTEVARNLAYDPSGTWQRMTVDPLNGRCLDYGRKVHDPPADLREHNIAVHRKCVHPGCGRHARRCHLDHHTKPGPTAVTPATTTSDPSATDTTNSNTTAAGPSQNWPAAATNGPPPPATPTPANLTPTPSPRRLPSNRLSRQRRHGQHRPTSRRSDYCGRSVRSAAAPPRYTCRSSERGRSVSVWASSRSTRGIALGTEISVAHSSGTSTRPSCRAA
jgi:hypothetical protein